MRELAFMISDDPPGGTSTARPSGFASPKQRAVSLSVAVGLHLVVLALLILFGTVRTQPPLRPPVAFDLTLPAAADDAGASAARGASPLETPVAPMPVPPAPASVVESEPVAEPVPIDMATMVPLFDAEPDPALTGDAPGAAAGAGASGDAGGGCSLPDAVRLTLETEPGTRDAMARIPRGARSVANAILLWDGDWIAPAAIGGSAVLQPIRDAIARTVAAASPACRAQAQQGPVFVIVAGAPDTVILALGSGAWRWSDLLGDVRPRTNDRTPKEL